MISLNSEYQYLGRSNAIKPCGATADLSDPGYGDIPAPPGVVDPGYRYYILLYAKTVEDPSTGKHRVTVRLRLACDGNSSFYGYNTSGSADVAGTSAFAWMRQSNPSTYWGDSPSLTEDGVTYRRWVDLKEGTVEVNAGYQECEISISASWRMHTVASPSKWLPTTTTAAVNTSVLLPAFAQPEEPEAAPTVSYKGIRVYADDALVYDSLIEEHGLVSLKTTTGLNVGGTAEIKMQRGHPAYNHFVWHKTVVTIYRGNVLRFRGRALHPQTNFIGERTVKCEGELCFLRDAVSRPHTYNGAPAEIFRTLIQCYNGQVESFKQFQIGAVTIPDEAAEIKIENAETILATINKLLDRCGGYIVFTTTSSGARAINWLAALNRRSRQTIEFGENLLDFRSDGANNGSLATGLIPYGAKDSATGKRITIESVNDGKDYIIAEDARAIRGTIMATVTWDDVTTPEELLDRAWALLSVLKSFVISLELTALDLSCLDKSLDSFTVGDTILVVSVPHGLNDVFQLLQMTEDFLNPAKSRFTLGKDVPSLTGSVSPLVSL